MPKLKIHYTPSTLSLVAAGLLMLSVVITGTSPTGFLKKPKPMLSSASGVFSASPNPIQVCDASGVGNTTFSWVVASDTTVELRKDGQSGTLLYQGQGSGSHLASDISEGANYYLFSVVTSTIYELRYIRGSGWRRVPVQIVTRQELGRITMAHTREGCSDSVGATTRAILPIVSATASSSFGGLNPDLVYDGSNNTMWNSGGFPTKYITFDLGKSQNISGVKLLTAQYPNGDVTHEVFVGNSTWPSQTKVHTFNGYTSDGQLLDLSFAPVIGRYVTINTTKGPSWVAWKEIGILGDAPNTSHVKYFGYFASATEGVGNGNYTSEIASHSNLSWVSGDWSQKLEQARANNMKAVLSVYWYFFDPQTYQLRPDYVQLWNQIVQEITPYRNDIAAFYLIDEPYHNARGIGVSDATVRQSIEQAISFIKQTFPEIPHAVYFAYAETDNNLVIPQGYDWVGVDCYGPFDNCYGKSIPEYYNILKSKMSAGQKLMIVPQAYWPTVSGVTDANQSDILTRAVDYYRLAANEPLTVAVTPFLWQSFEGGTGARDLQRVENWFIQMGKNVSGKP